LKFTTDQKLGSEFMAEDAC